MASPPAKRQRRSKVVLSGDDEEPAGPIRQRAAARINRSIDSVLTKSTATQRAADSTAPKPEPRSSTTKSKGTPTKAASKIKASPSPSPRKGTKISKKTAKEDGSKTLHTFFGRASEDQRWSRKVDSVVEKEDDGEDGDAIEDEDSLDEAFLELADNSEDPKLVLDRRKQGTTLIENGTSAARGVLSATTHKFVKPPIPTLKILQGQILKEELHAPWADRYGPVNLEELAVHRKKVADVQKWISEVLTGRDPRKILILKGPAGSGKTTTLSLLAKASNFQTVHWSNPDVSDSGMLASVASQFDDFVNRSGQFGSLDFGDPASINLPATLGEGLEAAHRILVVEEFPSIITRSSNALDSFRGVLLRFLAAKAPGRQAMLGNGKALHETQPPIVMIVSESLLTSATASADSFTAHRLLGPEISNHPLVTIMEFNTVAPTFVAKALDLVIKKEARDSQRRRIPGPAVLKRLSEMGDIRSAVNALEFLCARSADSEDWGGRVAAKAKKADKAGVALTAMEKSSLEMVTQREATLGMFHAVGKVVYNKRAEPQMIESMTEPPAKPPDHLSNFHKSRISQVNIDDLINETGTDIPTFISALHENYILSCNGSAFLESFDNCIGSLSDSDVLSPEGRSTFRNGYGNGGSSKGLSHAGGLDMLRQNEISFQVAVRGLLFALPYPVSRAMQPRGRKGDAFKMFYPASLRLWKPMEEIDSLISLLMDQMTFPNARGANRSVTGGSSDGGVASWKRNIDVYNVNTDDDTGSATPRVLTSRPEMLFDRLPYLSNSRDVKEVDLRKIKQVTQFHGVNLPEGNSADEAGCENPIDLSAADETTDRASSSPSKRDRIMKIVNEFGSAQPAALGTSVDGEAEIEKLYISDDDIQDD